MVNLCFLNNDLVLTPWNIVIVEKLIIPLLAKNFSPFLQQLKVHSCVHKFLYLSPTQVVLALFKYYLSQIMLILYLHLNIGFSKWSISFTFPYQDGDCISLPRTIPTTSLGISYLVSIINHVITNYTVSWCLLLLSPAETEKYLSQHPIIEKMSQILTLTF